MRYNVALQHPVYGDRDELLYVASKVVFRTTSRRKAKKYVRTLIRKGYDAYDVACAPRVDRRRKVRAMQPTLDPNDILF